jgi:hypothetical protein
LGAVTVQDAQQVASIPVAQLLLCAADRAQRIPVTFNGHP